MRIDDLLSDADRSAIRRATEDAEGRTAGEIVSYIVERIDDHSEGRWLAATLGSLSLALIAGAVHAIGGYWGGWGVLWITLPALVGAGLGYLIGGIDRVARPLIPSDTLDRRAQLRAEAAFLEEEMFRTRGRTGILILVALFEHRAVILADEGIHRAVPAGEWDRLVADLTAGIRADRAVQALVDVIEGCGELLARYEVDRRSDDENELTDAPRLRER
jgi:putative membrane protein